MKIGIPTGIESAGTRIAAPSALIKQLFPAQRLYLIHSGAVALGSSASPQ